MKISNPFLPSVLMAWGILFFCRLVKIGDQMVFRWKYAGLMLVSGIILSSLAFFLWKYPEISQSYRKEKKRFMLSLACLILPILSTFLPTLPIPYASIPSIAKDQIKVNDQTLEISAPLIYEVPESQRTLLDWLKLFSSKDINSYQNQAVDVSGMVSYDKDALLGQFTISRLTLTCCIADPIPVGLTVNWKESSLLPAGSWVRVQGKIIIVQVNGTVSPRIQADKVDIIPKPYQPYLFP